MPRVIACLRVAGFHGWPDAPPEVAFLRDRHRHLFTLRVEWEVDHAERQVEYFLAQRRMRETVTRAYPASPDGIDFGARSCETIAAELMRLLGADAAEVWEDDENGSRVSA